MKNAEPEMMFLLGLPFHDVTLDEVLDHCREMMRRDKPSYVVTANVDFTTQASEDEDLRRIVFFADRVVCDGMPLVWLSRISGYPLRERVAGSDMVPRLLEICGEEKHGVYFLGSDEKTLAEAKEIVEDRYPGLRVVGYESPPMGAVVEWDNEAMCERMRVSGAKLLLACLGCPKQERWIHAHHQDSGIALSIGVGASLDFITGKQKRAPKWMQKTGLEWFWRMSSNPKRMVGRYGADFVFLIKGAVSEWLLRRKREQVEETPRPAPRPVESEGVMRLAWSGSLEKERVEGAPIPEKLDGPVMLDLGGVDFMDSAGLGRFAMLVRRVREDGGRMVICGISAFVRRAFDQAKLGGLVPVFDEETAALAKLREGGGGGKVSAGGGETRVSFEGALDATALTSTRSVLEDAVAGGSGDVVLDLERVEFIDSRAVGLLIAVKKQLTAQGRELWLENPDASVRQVIGLLKLDKVLAVREVAA